MDKKKEVLILGFALFAMFFGAGNLIFPPSLGIAMGADWLVAGIAFLLTGVGLPLLGVLAFTKVGNLENFSARISQRFNTLYCTALILVIGPLFAIPRTGSVTFEMGVLPLFTKVDPFILSVVTAVLFFGATLILVIKESKITDIIGKFLTPIILVILAAIAVFGLTTDIGTPIDRNITSVFSKGFIEGYQTMDALASVIFGVVIVKGLEGKGIKEEREQRFFLSGSALIAATGLGLIYLSLLYLGARVSGSMMGANTTTGALYIAEVTLGAFGKIAFGVCVAAACLTTSVGLVAISADWFAKFTPISYKLWSIIICVFSGVMAVGGVDFIIKLSIPVLLVLYPLTIILILMNVYGVENRAVYKLGAYSTLIVAFLFVISDVFKISGLHNILLYIPLAKDGFVWVVPCIIAMIVGKFIGEK